MAEDRMLSDEILLGLINKNSGGGGGTSDYPQLTNKPQINGNTLVGNKTASDLGLVAAETGKGLSTNDFTDAYKTAIGDNTTAIGANTSAISSIKDGQTINSFSDVETALTLKQNTTDNNLQTTSKEIVGALNEINSKLNSLGLSVVNGKVCQTYLA